jgi:4-amino-4-deoxy-L-arabinose transferase-like glycosyltransferase
VTAATRALLAVAVAIAVVVACRLWLAEALPLTDTTEARFAEIARKMVETGDFIVPQHDYGVAYLAKPPLAFWLSAAGIALFGADELGPRVLILAATLAFAAFLFRWTRAELGAAAAAAATAILLSSLLFFVAAAAVMTDMILTVCMSTALLAVWRRMHGGGVSWEVAAFVALGLGLIAKGPIAGVLVAAPLAASALLSPRSRAGLARIAWGRGVVLAALIALPWYVAAEWRNPGFLRYFIVGEYIERFLHPGWTGDLYGRAHDAPRGTIWLFFVVGALPWSIIGALGLITGRAAIRRRWGERRDLAVFLTAAALAPLALFTLSGNVIFPYALPALPPAVLAFVVLGGDAAAWQRRLPRIAVTAVIAAAAYTSLVAANGEFTARQSQRAVIAAIRSADSQSATAILYWDTRYFSADYYTRGAARVVKDAAPIEALLARREEFRLVASEKVSLPPELAARVRVAGQEAGMVLYAPPHDEPAEHAARAHP